MTASAAPGQQSSALPRRCRWRVLVPVLTLTAVAVLLVLTRDRLAAALRDLASVRWEWLVVAVALEGMSMAGLARQQRHLLRAGGGHAPLSAVVATTYAGNTISVGLPVAGPAAGTLYTFRRLKELGNGAALVSWVLAVSGIFSTVSFALVIAIAFALVGSPAGIAGAVLAALVAVVPSAALLVAVRSPALRQRLLDLLRRRGRTLVARIPRLDAVRVDAAVAGFVRQLARQRLRGRDGVVVAFWSLLNWLADAACLAVALHAVGAPVPWTGLLLAWAAGAGAATLGLTPGGIGVVEAALTAALVGVTVPLQDAVPAVLVYRFISLWLVLAVGAVLLALPRRPVRRRPPGSTAAGPPASPP